MKELTWTEALFMQKTLKNLRDEDNLTIPIEYINSTRKLVQAMGLWVYVLGIIAGFLIGNI